MNDDDQGRRELDAAAEVFAATREIDDAIADLAARPLDEAAADRMRSVLAGAGLAQARAAMHRLAGVPRSERRNRLSVVPGEPDDAESERAATGAVGGAA